jgi:tetraacyldisaccharide 4'-kinase
MVEYLTCLLEDRYRIATLSRGYKRRTRGYILAGPGTTALEIGDEPMQFHIKHPGIYVAVGEKRSEAIPQILFDRPDTQVVILDDAFQHRAISAGFNILLTEHDNLYTRDFFLPTGDLRDQRKSAARADLIVVTKCSQDLTAEKAEAIRKELGMRPGQQVFFSTIRYGRPFHLQTKEPQDLRTDMEVLLVSGIANPAPLKAYLQERTHSFDAMQFRDHHIFNIDDIREIRRRFNEPCDRQKIILTTEKDAVRLLKFGNELSDLPFYVLPISISFLFSGEKAFNDLIHNFMERFTHGRQAIRHLHEP